jgi:hypothetical protein
MPAAYSCRQTSIPAASTVLGRLSAPDAGPVSPDASGPRSRSCGYTDARRPAEIAARASPATSRTAPPNRITSFALATDRRSWFGIPPGRVARY